MDLSVSIQGVPVRVGERVVYPNGGICRVQGVESRQIAGRDWNMLVLQREEDQARVLVPQEKVESIGLRKVASREAAAALLEFLASAGVDPELDWKVRHRENFEKMAAGSLLDTAQVLKGLHALSRLRPLPTREREMYDSARHQLVGEMSAALGLPPAVAENQLDYALTPPPGSGRTAAAPPTLDLAALRRSLGGKRLGGASRGPAEAEDEDEFGGLDGIEEDETEAESDEETGAEGVEAESGAAPSPAKPTVAAKSGGTKSAASPSAARKPPEKKTVEKPPAKKSPSKKPSDKAGENADAKTSEKSAETASGPAKSAARKSGAKTPVEPKAPAERSAAAKKTETGKAKSSPAKGATVTKKTSPAAGKTKADAKTTSKSKAAAGEKKP